MTSSWRFENVRIVACLASVAVVAGVQSPASAQVEAASSAKSFPAEFFAPFNPVSAEDMVRRVPGFSLSNGEDRRGFAGAAGNVLVNGERPSSKIPISEQLARLAARDVLRIDLYAGGANAGELGGQTLYVDVRLRPREAVATNTFVAQVSRLDPSGSVNPLIVANTAFSAGGATVNLGLQAQPSRRGRIEYDKQVVTAAGAPVESGQEFLQGSYWEYKLSGRAAWKPSEIDALSVNAQLTPSRDGRHTYSEVFNPAGNLLRVEDSEVRGDDAWAGELGGDWERTLSPQASFKVAGLASAKHTGSDERYTTRFATGARRDTLIDRAADSGEYIARGVYTWRAGTDNKLEFGAEGAFNFLDSALDMNLRTAGGTTNITPPVANTRVEEWRGEAYASNFWKLTPQLSLESSVAIETSRITQTGDAEQERDFTFVKPRIRAIWNSRPDEQVRILIERDVAQLDFTEFASAVSLFDGTQNIGNPDLEPERTWRAQIDWERRFGKKGVVALSLFHDMVEAVQDQIPIAGLDGPGNLGDGARTGIRLDAVAPLDGIGLTGAELRVKGLVQESDVDDPVTGLSRRFSDEPNWSYSIDFRQPLPEWKLVWGGLVERADDVRLFRLREVRTTGLEETSIDLYVETTAIAGLVVRFTLQEVLQPVEARTRTFFAPDRSSVNGLSSVETRLATGGYATRSIGVRVSGRF